MSPAPTAATADEPAIGAGPAVAAATRRVGIVGAGKLGTALARAALAAGYEVAIASSGATGLIALTVDVLAPGAAASTVDQVLEFTDVIVLAVPAHRFRELASGLFDGKILIDAMNYWPDTDGADPELAAAEGGSSTVVQAHFPGARVVKSLNQLGYHELDEYPRAPGAPDRIAVAAVGDDRLAVRTAMHLIDRLGFDPVDGGLLADGKLLRRLAVRGDVFGRSPGRAIVRCEGGRAAARRSAEVSLNAHVAAPSGDSHVSLAAGGHTPLRQDRGPRCAA